MWRVGDQATYECNTGFQLSGRTTLRCLFDGNWSNKPSECRGKKFFVLLKYFRSHLFLFDAELNVSAVVLVNDHILRES